MKDVSLIVQEQYKNLGIIFRLSKYEEKATYQSHYLGLLWQILNPMIQIGIYYMIFGLGVNGGGEINGIPFIVWMMIGISVWFFISSSVLGASNSIFRNVGLVSKMKFPISVLPSISIASNVIYFLWMLGICILFLVAYGIYPTLYWLQLPYYFLMLFVFLFSFSLFNATITTLVRDYHILLQSIMRVVFFISGSIWDIDNRNLPIGLVKLLKLNPFYYLIEGFRDSFFSRQWFWEKGNLTLFFWVLTLLLLLIGSHLHLKFRARFVDFI